MSATKAEVSEGKGATVVAQPEPEAQEENKHSAELKGDKVKVLHDFQRRVMLDEKPLLVLDKYGCDVRESMTDWHFVWFDEADVRKFSRVGYQVVDPRKVEVEAPAQDEKTKAEFPDRIVLNELTLCRIPKVEWLAWNQYVEDTKNKVNEQSLEEQADRNISQFSEGVMDGADRGYGGIKSRRGK